MAKKHKTADDYLYHLFIHMNAVNQFVIFSGLTLKQFFGAVESIKNILLLNQSYEDGLFNMHTQLDYIPGDEIKNFVKKMEDSNRDLCWVDFSDEKQVNQLTPMEQAELLYLGHKKEPVTSPFFPKLKNRYVYCSSANEQTTKVYFRFLEDFEMLVSTLINNIIKENGGNGGFWRRKSKERIPKIEAADLKAYRHYFKEGALVSIYKAEKPKNHFGVEIRTLSDYDYPDEVWNDLIMILKQDYDELIKLQ
ncbi:hypothetical protein [Ureibacillus terrenus]|uniref:Uncharacterized protein n=1 Tax=Ureibacillus terrenus TaxID=118246 RepID=A0A540V101_9BACL|nr:hypothetical protein [Ureibacillus terrenus]TQE90418.1 hypothetical protein FKZ59_10215 [Ureibacillus terrenus]